MNVTYIWLTAGVIVIGIDALGLSGIGLLFAGMGAITTGVLVNFGYLSYAATAHQFIAFFIGTLLWIMLLWVPIQKFRTRNDSKVGDKNIVGDTAYVGSSGLYKGSEGEVTWSGTIMQAILIQDAVTEHLDAGSQVIIVDVVGATLMVKPKQ